MTRVLVVDDHAPLRRLMVEILSEAEDLVVVGECRDGEQVVDAVLRSHPDVVVMDVHMPGLDGLDATRVLLSVVPQARVLLLTAAPGMDSSTEQARRVGAVGYVSKGDTLELPHLVRVVAGGGTAWPRRPVEPARAPE
jgi:DNA-binding NarL/FixJ family response regulator